MCNDGAQVRGCMLMTWSTYVRLCDGRKGGERESSRARIGLRAFLLPSRPYPSMRTRAAAPGILSTRLVVRHSNAAGSTPACASSESTFSHYAVTKQGATPLCQARRHNRRRFVHAGTWFGSTSRFIGQSNT